MKPNKDDLLGYTKTFYIKTISELDDFIAKYKYNCNLFVGLSTYQDKVGKADHAHARKVMFLDFDKKDFPQYEDIKDFTEHIKRKIPFLFNHCLVSSGNGFHFYIATQRTIDISRAVRINKNLAQSLGADLKAVSPTQLVRLPSSFNLKHDKKPVLIVSNNYGAERFKPYTLNKLEQIISYIKQANEIKAIEALTPVEYNKTSSYFCIQKMLSEGAKKGERNFCLGRITKYLKDIKGYRNENALKLILEWNCKCAPPKSIEEVKNDFNRYWESDYRLLGCNLDNPSNQLTLNKYCEKINCITIFQESDTSSKIRELEVKMDNHLLQNCDLKRLRGNHYLILSVLHIHSKGLTLERLKEEITNPNTHKCCLSKNTIKSILGELLDKYITCNVFGVYQLIDIANFGFGYTRYYYSATILLINGIIKQQEYLVYLCLVRNLQMNKDVSYYTLAEDTGIDKSNIGKYINNLFKSKILLIEKLYNEKGVLCNAYTLVA